MKFHNVVQIIPVKPNKMFADWQNETTFFLRYTKPVPCAECGSKRKHHWTSLVSFRACSLGRFQVVKGLKILPPLSPVCRSHVLATEFEDTIESGGVEQSGSSVAS